MTGSASWPVAKDTVESGTISWSPDGRVIAFARRDGIYALDTGTGQVSRLTAAPAATPRFAVSPAWSPDGSRIAFRGGDGIYRLTVATGEMRRLAAIRRDFHQLAWSPDGRWIAFDGPDERCDLNLTLYVVSAEGGATQRLSATPPCFEARSPSWTSR
jgi:Tol biopolymer transport system component